MTEREWQAEFVKRVTKKKELSRLTNMSEYEQTKIRYEKLKNFCNKVEIAEMTGTEAPKHDCPLELLREQKEYMRMYLSVLEKCALIEVIDIQE